MFYPILKIILFFIFLFIFYIIFDIELEFKDIYNIISYLNDSDSDRNISVGSGATVNINNPRINTSISEKSINTIAAAISSAGGAGIGFKVAQYVGGPPFAKIAAGLGTMIVIQGTTAIMTRILNNNTNSGNNIRQNLVYFSLTSENNNINSLNDYPLNLLPDINLLLYGALLFIYIILNIYISKYLLSLNYNKFIPNNNFGKILSFLINRYLKI